MKIGNSISISLLKHQKAAKLVIVYSTLITYYKQREVFIVGESPSSKSIPASALSGYNTGFKSKSNLFIEHSDELTNGTKIIRSGYMIFLGAELYALDEIGQVYKHSERTGLIDMTVSPGLRIGKSGTRDVYNRRLSMLT